MKHLVLSLIFCSSTFSFVAMAETYNCSSKDVKVSYEVNLDIQNTNGFKGIVYNLKTYNEKMELLEQVSGFGSVSKAYDNNSVKSNSYILADGSEFVFEAGSKIKFIKRNTSGSVASFTSCN